MRLIWALLVVIACQTEDDDRAPICVPCDGRIHLYVYADLVADQIADATIELCVNATSCSHTRIDDGCRLGECVFTGAFDATIRTTSSILAIQALDAASHSDAETWSIEITDVHGARLFTSSARAALAVKPAACGFGMCQDLIVDFR